MSDFTPIVCPLSRVAPIEGADRIRRAEASGYVVVVGANRVEGETGVLFPSGGCLHPAFVEAAGLAHLAAGGRVKEIRLRGVRSEGLWMSWQEFNGALEGCKDVSMRPLAQVSEGPLSLTIEGAPIFEKYVPRTRYACGERVIKPPKDPRVTRVFPELYETEALFREAGEIPIGATCIATLKVHGESFRLAHAVSWHPDAPSAGIWVGTDMRGDVRYIGEYTYKAGDVNDMPHGVFHLVTAVEPGTVTHMECGPLQANGKWHYLVNVFTMGKCTTLEDPAGDPNYIANLRAINPYMK